MSRHNVLYYDVNGAIELVHHGPLKVTRETSCSACTFFEQPKQTILIKKERNIFFSLLGIPSIISDHVYLIFLKGEKKWISRSRSNRISSLKFKSVY